MGTPFFFSRRTDESEWVLPGNYMILRERYIPVGPVPPPPEPPVPPMELQYHWFKYFEVPEYVAGDYPEVGGGALVLEDTGEGDVAGATITLGDLETGSPSTWYAVQLGISDATYEPAGPGSSSPLNPNPITWDPIEDPVVGEPPAYVLKWEATGFDMYGTYVNYYLYSPE